VTFDPYDEMAAWVEDAREQAPRHAMATTPA
jgi:hypothetical protein